MLNMLLQATCTNTFIQKKKEQHVRTHVLKEKKFFFFDELKEKKLLATLSKKQKLES